jgi:tetratricopeptide (TPR) repeat protein
MGTTDFSFSWYDVPAAIKQLLVSAADAWDDTERSQDFIQQAIASPDASLDVLVAAYRYFFYKHKLDLALRVADRVIEQVRQAEALPQDWHHLKPILRRRREEPPIRLYLNAYAASGYMLARLGAIDAATEITARVMELDPKRESCAPTVFDVLTRPDEEDDE